jgi:small conductance mechanosensitive channel
MLEQFSAVAQTYWTQFIYLLPRLLVAAVVLAGVWLASGRLRVYLAGKLQAHAADPLLTNFLTEVGRWLLVLGGVLLALQIVGFSGVVGGLLGGLGLSAFLVGFAFKDIAENFLAGVILAFNRPFHINDNIQIKDLKGRVQELNLRTTRIKTADGKDIYVPNSLVLKEPVVNFTRDGQIRQDFALSVPHTADAEHIMQLVLEEMRREAAVLKDEKWQPTAAIEEINDGSVTVRVFFWTSSDQPRKAQEARSRLINQAKHILLTNTAEAPVAPTEVKLVSDSPALRVAVENAANQNN